MIERIRKSAGSRPRLVFFDCALHSSHILLAKTAGHVLSVSENASKFLGTLPPGVALGVALILLLYWFVKSRDPREPLNSTAVVVRH